MALIIKDRVKEISTTVGTGPISVGTTPVTGYVTVNTAIGGNGNTTPYVIEHQTDGTYEIGLGQYYSSNNSISRLQVLASSNTGNLVNFASGNKNVFITIPAAYSALTVLDLSQFARTTSANLLSIISDETGSGSLVFSNNAVLVAPTLGVASATSLTLNTALSVSNGGTGLISLTTGYIPYGNGTGAIRSSANLFFNGTQLGIGNNIAGLSLRGVLNPQNFAGVSGIANAITSFGYAGYSIFDVGLLGDGSPFWNTDAQSQWAPSATAVWLYRGTEKARIDANGNFGIGTSSPSAKLDILSTTVSQLKLTGNTGSSQGAYVNIQGNSIGNYSAIIGGVYNSDLMVYGGGGSNVWYQSPGAHIWNAGGSSEDMRLDASGNLGVGFSSPSTYGKLAVNGAGYFNGTFTSIGGAVFYKSANVTVNNGLSLGTVSKSVAPLGGTGQFSVLSDDATNQLQGFMALITDPTATNRRFQFYCIEQGITYRNITFQEVGGNVGIGTAIPSKKLDVLTEMGYVTSTSAAQNDYLTFGAGGTLANGQSSTWNVRRGYDNVSLVTLDGNGNFYNGQGTIWKYTPAPTVLNAGANQVTAAQLRGDLFTTTATTAVTMTLPVANTIDAIFASTITTNIGFDFHVINNGTSLGAITISANTGITNGGIAGNLTVTIGTYSAFRLRRTAANTYILYRIG